METGVAQYLQGATETVYFNDWGDSVSQGGVLQITRISGADGAEIRSSHEGRPQRDGAILHPSFRDGLAFNLEGVILPSGTGRVYRENRRILEDLLKRVTQTILRVDGLYSWTPSYADDDPDADDRERTARLIEPVEIHDENSAIKSFVIPLFSEDSYARGFIESIVDISPSGTETITNAGNAPYFPVVEIYGALGTFTLQNNTPDPSGFFGDIQPKIAWDGLGHTIPNGDFDTIQMDFERIIRTAGGGGSGESELRYVDFVTSDFFPLWPGDNDISFNASGTGGATKARVYAHNGWV